MGGIDLAVTVSYLVFIVALGCSAAYWNRRRGKGEAEDYFLAGGTLRWPIIGLALFATNISCVHLVSLAQSGYDSGLLNGNFEWMAAFTLIMLGLFFAPFYIRSRVPTLPDFLERRYCRSCRDWLAVLSMCSAVTIHIGFSFLTGGIVLKTMFGVDMYTSIIVVAVLTGLYTIIGGLMAVVLTEAIQTVVLIAGAMLITWFAWDKMGGWDPMVAVLETKNALGEDQLSKLSMLRPHGDASQMPWYSIFLGYPVLGIWYWCADQTIVQRVLGARSEDHARIGPLFASVIKILPVFIFVMPGLFAFTLAQSGLLNTLDMQLHEKRAIGTLLQQKKLDLDLDRLASEGIYDPIGQTILLSAARERNLLSPDQAALIESEGQPQADEFRNLRVPLAAGELQLDTQRLASAGVLDPKTGVLNVTQLKKQELVGAETLQAVLSHGEVAVDSKGVYGVMILELMPNGLRGVMVAALLAALMSTVSGALNSISTLFSYDLYKRFRPAATDHQLVFVGRVTAAVALVIAIGLVPLLNDYKSIFEGLNEILAHLAPPVTCVFLLGVFWPRASAISAKWTLWLGSALGAAVFLIGKLAPDSGVAMWIAFISGGSFMMVAFYLFAACVTMQVLFALRWPAGKSERSSELYWQHPFDPLRSKGWPGLANYKFLTFALLAVMVTLYYLFR